MKRRHKESSLRDKGKPKAASCTTVDVVVPTPPRTPPPPSPRTISELLSHRAIEEPNKPILAYPSVGTQYQVYTYAELDRFSAYMARLYSQSLSIRQSSNETERVIALLGLSDLDYLVTALALSRLGFTVLFLSTRLSEIAYESLLDATECHAIVVGATFQRLATSLESKVEKLSIVKIISCEHLSSIAASSEKTQGQNLDLDIESTKVSWIIHSSGSTGLPKPIYQTHQAALYNYTNNMNMKGFITLPLYHAHGLSSVFRAICSRKLIYMYSATLPMTKQNLLEIMRENRSVFEIFYGVPYALKLLSESDEGIRSLADMKVVMFGGSACPDALGDHLTEHGVNLISHYGTTETGQLMTSSRPSGDKGWNYVRVSDRLEPYVRFEEKSTNLFELVVLEGWPSMVATNRPDAAYATKDLFEPHPSIPSAWKYSGRLDDTIVLVNGEKAVPNALEQAVRRLPLVREAVVFGVGRAQLGILIIAADETTSDALLDAVWPTIEQENKSMPSYAQITVEMAIVLPVDTPYPQTDKGTVIRQGLYRAFEKEINVAYSLTETKSSGTLVLNINDMMTFLRREIVPLVASDDLVLEDDTDLFSLGIDSLQSTRLRITILKNLQFNSQIVPPNVVFENPTIAQLADRLVSIRESRVNEKKDIINEMEALIQKYDLPFQQPHNLSRIPETPGWVLVTGATGSLGAHVVAQLADRADVPQVVCLVRARTDQAARLRVLHSLQERALYHTLPLLARRKIIYYKADLTGEELGLSSDTYQHLLCNISTVIHCAWSVNFNKNLASLEECIAGTHNLLKFSSSVERSRPASFNFCSSVSTVAATPGYNIPEALPSSLSYAQGMGYAQSKLVTEHLVTRAATAGLQSRVIRVGQIVADTSHGIWNDTEAIPLMLQSAVSIGVLPTLDESPRWLPVDTVATSVIDISLSSVAPSQTVYNLVNPKTFRWTHDLLPCLRAAGLQFEEVSPREWVKRLRVSNPDPVQNPTIKLVEFFASKYDDDGKKGRATNFVTSSAESLSPRLTSMPKLSQDLVTKFVRCFLKTSWASPTDQSTFLQTRSLIVVTGPNISGKSKVATGLAEHFGCVFVEGGSVQDSSSTSKTSNGTPMSDISRLKMKISEQFRSAQFLGSQPDSDVKKHVNRIVVVCSILDREHRNALRTTFNDPSIFIHFVILQAGEERSRRRTEETEGYHSKQSVAASQVYGVDQPEFDEVDVLPVDVQKASVGEIVDTIVTLLD